MPADAPKRARAHFLAAVVAALVVAIVGATNVSMRDSLGYDEAMHAFAPAARMLVAARTGEWAVASDALLSCEQYPFAHPLLLALVQAISGLSEPACRAIGRVLLAVALLGIFALAQRAAAGAAREGVLSPGRARWAPWLALLAALCSPLALAYSGTLFLEVPFLAAGVWAAVLWLARRDAPPARLARTEVAAGALLALAFFTKFNYGVLLCAGCGLDFLIEGVAAARARALRPWLLSAARLAAVPAIVLAWWFLLPLPGGLDTAASHRETFWSFLQGNQTLGAPKSFRERALDWMAGVFVTPRAFVAGAVLALAALRFARARHVRTLALLALAFVLPIALHPYHLDRFLLPGAAFVWALVGIGLAGFLPKSGARSLALVAALCVLCGLRRDLDTRGLPAWVVPPSSPEIAAYQREVIAEKISLSPSRPLPTAGLHRADSDALLDLFAEAVRRDLHVGWLAAPEKLSPAALQLGLVARGGAPARFLDDPADALILGVSQQDPGWDDARLAAAVAPFDVIFASEPAAGLGAPSWAFLAGYRRRLVEHLGWTEELFGPVALHPPFGPERSVRIVALRRAP